MKTYTLQFFLLFFVTGALHFQLNSQDPPKDVEFVIGMMGAPYLKDVNNDNNAYPNITETISGNVVNTSAFNVLAEDGFNVSSNYLPNEYFTISRMQSYISLANQNGMKVLTGIGNWYKAGLNADADLIFQNGIEFKIL